MQVPTYLLKYLFQSCQTKWIVNNRDRYSSQIDPLAYSYVPINLFTTPSQVRLHERMLKDQAKKMNVKSLTANKDDASKSVEIRIAKVAFTIFFLFVCAWTPYAFVTMTGAFGDRSVACVEQFGRYSDRGRSKFRLPNLLTLACCSTLSKLCQVGRYFGNCVFLNSKFK